MAKQKHDIGYQKQLKRELFAQATPRRTKQRGLGPIPPELAHRLNLHSLQGEDHLQRVNSQAGQ
jgi:hypothetical protein